MRKLCKILTGLLFVNLATAQIKETDFANPNNVYKPVPLWFWNNTSVQPEELVEQFRQMILHDGYGGCGILPFGKDFKPEYLSEDYLRCYGEIVKEAKKLNAAMSLYDEYGFPSGSMGAINGDDTPRFMNKYSNHTIKRLDKIEYPVKKGKTKIAIPEGKLMAVVAMDTLTKERLSLRDFIQNNCLEWSVPQGSWKVMFFVCVKDGDPNVDYLDPEAVKLFIKETHQVYYDRFSTAFGSVIKETFFDEPTMYRAKGRMWTPLFNEKYTAYYHGESPELLYPALWYDIGNDTQYARNRLFGFRSKLYAEGFMKTIQNWGTAHNIHATGHQDQEEILNPVSVSGDLMLWNKYIDIPGIDKIGGGRPTEDFYKVISSAAYNWDKQLVMSETYGAMGNLNMHELYHIAMEQYTKGINALIPHAVWYNDQNVTFLPELSWRNPLYQDSLPKLNKFLSRLNYVLRQEGCHVADIAVLYPIETLQGEHYLDGPLGFYEGGVNIPLTDYTHVSALLTDSLGRDFTYLHPEVLLEKCTVENDQLVMNNKINKECFQVIILPSVKTISINILEKILQFQQQGGKVIFTTRLPKKSTEFRQDQKVQTLTKALLSQAIFIKDLNSFSLQQALTDCHYSSDVRFLNNQNLNYIHKVTEKQHIYYFANLRATHSHTEIALRGRLHPKLFNPHNGTASDIQFRHEGNTTYIKLSIPANSSVFIVSSSS